MALFTYTYVAVFLALAFLPTVVYVLLLPGVIYRAYLLDHPKELVVIGFYVAVPLAAWTARYAGYEQDRLAFEARVRTVPLAPMPDDLPSTLVTDGRLPLSAGPGCFADIRLGSPDPADLPERYLRLRLRRGGPGLQPPHRGNPGTAYELLLVEGASETTVAFEYPFPERPPVFPPVLTLNGWFTGSNSTSTDETARREAAFLARATGLCLRGARPLAVPPRPTGI